MCGRREDTVSSNRLHGIGPHSSRLGSYLHDVSAQSSSWHHFISRFPVSLLYPRSSQSLALSSKSPLSKMPSCSTYSSSFLSQRFNDWGCITDWNKDACPHPCQLICVPGVEVKYRTSWQSMTCFICILSSSVLCSLPPVWLIWCKKQWDISFFFTVVGSIPCKAFCLLVVS